ncbi:hypothetical protein H0H93_002645, partial [Arthromyces matolae]
MVKFCKAVNRRTGFNVSVVCGGPDPANGGKVQTLAIHEGTNQLGHNFAQAHVGYQDAWLRPYVAFAKSCFVPSADPARKPAHSVDASSIASAREPSIKSVTPVLDVPPLALEPPTVSDSTVSTSSIQVATPSVTPLEAHI